MRSRWSDEEAAGLVATYGTEWGEPLALRTYTARLLGSEPDLVLHGGGNCSVKTSWTDVFGEEIPALFVKASGADMAIIEPAGLCGLELDYLRRLRGLVSLDDEAMVEQLRTHLLRAGSPDPSIEALVHAFLPYAYVDHTHADAVLALTNRTDADALVPQVFGDDVVVLPYVTPGFKLAVAAAEAFEERPDSVGMVWAHHGIVTWGETARESYEAMIALVSRAEEYVESGRSRGGAPPTAARRAVASRGAPGVKPPGSSFAVAGKPDHQGQIGERLAQVLPVLRGLLAARTGDCDHPYRRVVLKTIIGSEVSAALSGPGAREAFCNASLTSDHLIRTKALPLWVEDLPYDDPAGLRERLEQAVDGYREDYQAYLARNAEAMPAGVEAFAPEPRVVMIPGLGVVCAGPDLQDALIARDITAHTLGVKIRIRESGAEYLGLPEEELFSMEYRTLQHAKLHRAPVLKAPSVSASSGAAGAGSVSGGRASTDRAVAAEVSGGSATGRSLRGHVALVTGAAGAIGTGICRGLLEAGSLVAATDLAGDPLDTLVGELGAEFPSRIAGFPLDVTDPELVKNAFDSVVGAWGGVDLVVPNAGVAMVAPLVDLSLDGYRKLERVNVEGTLLVLAEAGRLFKRQATGGDIVLVSTKNVFSPGADFGAYSSTKAAAHQLARIASLELAGDDVRVNMVAPDAVFACGECRSGLWAEVGPGRMKARGLDEAGLEAYYQNRNLLKVRVTADHVANAVLFFATRETPTTGATIPVDGGLPDSTPR
ncbi:MAG: bifunctional aldolase/short-chain dehydrogenase [Actinobacteria bacterium]|nr:bifunctional aldolase/short-chain dehydrogenase [Actinomycetota bacterium]